MRADFGEGGEQVPVQESRSWQSNAGRVYQERAKPVLAGCGTIPRSHGSCCAMPTQNWREVYEVALLELDTRKLPRRVEAAFRAIQHRSLQKKETLSRKEREEIGDALRELVEVMRRRGA